MEIKTQPKHVVNGYRTQEPFYFESHRDLVAAMAQVLHNICNKNQLIARSNEQLLQADQNILDALPFPAIVVHSDIKKSEEHHGQSAIQNIMQMIANQVYAENDYLVFLPYTQQEMFNELSNRQLPDAYPSLRYIESQIQTLLQSVLPAQQYMDVDEQMKLKQFTTTRIEEKRQSTPSKPTLDLAETQESFEKRYLAMSREEKLSYFITCFVSFDFYHLYLLMNADNKSFYTVLQTLHPVMLVVAMDYQMLMLRLLMLVKQSIRGTPYFDETLLDDNPTWNTQELVEDFYIKLSFYPQFVKVLQYVLSHDNLVAEQGVQLNAYREMLDNFVHMQSIEDESVSDN